MHRLCSQASFVNLDTHKKTTTFGEKEGKVRGVAPTMFLFNSWRQMSIFHFGLKVLSHNVH